MSRLDKPADFSALREKYADSALWSRVGWNAGRGRSDSVPSRNDAEFPKLDKREDFGLAQGVAASAVVVSAPKAVGKTLANDLEQDLHNLKKTRFYLATRNRSPKQLQILGAEFDHRREPDFRAASKQFSENSSACRSSTRSHAERRKVVANSENTAKKTKDCKSANSR